MWLFFPLVFLCFFQISPRNYVQFISTNWWMCARENTKTITIHGVYTRDPYTTLQLNQLKNLNQTSEIFPSSLHVFPVSKNWCRCVSCVYRLCMSVCVLHSRHFSHFSPSTSSRSNTEKIKICKTLTLAYSERSLLVIVISIYIYIYVYIYHR